MVTCYKVKFTFCFSRGYHYIQHVNPTHKFHALFIKVFVSRVVIVTSSLGYLDDNATQAFELFS